MDIDITFPLSTGVMRDLIRFVCEAKLGEGVARTVYVLGTDTTKVIKIENDAGSFQNVAEWQLWNEARGTKYERFLAPCHCISPSGSVLVMSRVSPLPPDDDPRMRRLKLPSFLTDFKRENYGLLKGRVVCCDYGSHLATNHGAFGSKMRVPKWWSLPK